MRHIAHLRLVGSIATLAAVVALVAPALAAGASYGGALDGGGTLSFRTVTKGGKIVNVKNFSWKGVPTTCRQGAYSYTAQLPFSMSVAQLGFAVKATGGGVIQAVSGHFRDRRRKAAGILNVYGNLAPGHTSCSSGNIRWSATRR